MDYNSSQGSYIMQGFMRHVCCSFIPETALLENLTVLMFSIFIGYHSHPRLILADVKKNKRPANPPAARAKAKGKPGPNNEDEEAPDQKRAKAAKAAKAKAKGKAKQ